MAYTAVDKSTDHFNTVLYSGNGGTQTITGVGFQPDWLWIKERSVDGNHQLLDSVRSSFTKNWHTNSTSAEGTTSTYITSVNSDGFAVGTNNGINQSGVTNVAWCWKAATSVSGNSSGSGSAKAYTGTVNTDAGISIIRYVGNGTNGHTIPHHLGAAPRFLFCKRLDSATGGDGTVLHMGMSGGASDFIELNSTGAKQTNIARFRNTAPTSSVFTIASGVTINGDDSPYIAHIFAEKKGFSKFGSYTGNGNADGTFVYTGFKPAWVMVKRTDSSGAWRMWDNKREGLNGDNAFVYANYTNAEEADGTVIDLLSNGFKFRNSSGDNNSDGASYIFMSFAENPFVSSTGVPGMAR